MVFTDYVKQRILFYHQQEHKSRNIRNLLLGEGLIVSHVGIYRFLKRFEKCGTIDYRIQGLETGKITGFIRISPFRKLCTLARALL